MNNIINVNKKYLNIIKSETLNISGKILKKKFLNIENIFSKISNAKKRSQLFDALNMMVSLQILNYQVKNQIEKRMNCHLLNWTYPQIRLDGDFANDFSAPLHMDRWILDKEKRGYVIWIPINKKGSTLLLSKKHNLKKIVRHSYWGLEAKDNLKLKKVHIPFGKALIFDEKKIHKSDNTNNNRITIQLRYEIANFKNFKRTVNQVIDKSVKKYWINKYK